MSKRDIINLISKILGYTGMVMLAFIVFLFIIDAISDAFNTPDELQSWILIIILLIGALMKAGREVLKKTPERKMKIGLDIHGVCDANPEFFVELSRIFVEAGHEVHILTGRRVSDGALEEVKELGLSYTHFMSISDYHKSIGTKMWEDENGNPWLDGEMWDRTKGDYCKKFGIDFCLDDTERYGQYFETPFGFIKIKTDEKVSK